jgi:hypothetical protein
MSKPAETDEIVELNEFEIEKIPLSCTWIVIAPPGSGKTSFEENLCYYNRHRYPVGRFILGSETSYVEWQQHFPALFISNSYKDQEVKYHIVRQKHCKLEKNPASAAVLIIDDVGEESKVFKTKAARALYKNGSQHYEQLLVWGNQNAMDFPGDVRNNASYIAIGRNMDNNELEKIFDQFGGIFGTLKIFKEYMRQITGEYTFLIIKKRSQSNNIKDNVFWYTVEDPKKHGKWKFGCQEYWAWHESRMDPNYQETIEF